MTALQSNTLTLLVLEKLDARDDGHGYDPLTIDGYTDDEVETVVRRLWRLSYVNAAVVKRGFGTTIRERVDPSTLTSKGRAHLADLTRK